MNGYARLSHVKADIAGLPAAVSDLDSVIARQIEETSREFDTECGRRFFSRIETRYYSGRPNETGRTPYRYYPFDPDGDAYLAGGGRYFNGHRNMLLGDDLLSVTELLVDQDRDGAFETALTENTDYYLWPENAGANGVPYRGLELTPNASVLYWPVYSRTIKITGIFGYSNELEATGQTVKDAAGINSSVTTITVTSTADLAIGDTLAIGTEQIDVIAVATPTTLTVTRGINGTTAAVHALNDAISRRRFPRDIEQVVKERVVGLRWDSQGGFNTSVALMGEAGVGMNTTGRASYARWRRVTDNYSNIAGMF